MLCLGHSPPSADVVADYVAMAQTQSKLVLTFWERSPPLAVLAAAEIAGVQLDAKADPKFTKDSSILLSLTSTRYNQASKACMASWRCICTR